MSEPQAGHNSKEQLQSIVSRIENLNEEIKERREGQKEIYAEAKSNGWDSKIIRKVVAIRAKDPDVLAEEEAILETYMSALGPRS